nr:hypothetical protein [Tanacetum cinerariifolium]
MTSLPTRRVSSPSNTPIKALPVLRKDLPRIRGTQGSASQSTTMKSVGKWNVPTLTKTSSATPTERDIERSTSLRVIHIGDSSGRDSLFHTYNGMRFMLAPRSARAMHSAIPGKSHGMRNLSGSPSFSGNFLRKTTKQCSFSEVLANSNSLSLLVNKLLIDGPNLGIRMRASAKLMLKFKSLNIWKNFSLCSLAL